MQRSFTENACFIVYNLSIRLSARYEYNVHMAVIHSYNLIIHH